MKRLLPFFHASYMMQTMLIFLFTAVITVTQAQDCRCDFVINPPADPSTSVFVNGESLGVKPGQRLCLNAGFYKQIRFSKLSGEPGKPITIINCGGLVEIGNSTNFGEWYATDFVTCKYIRFTGTGDAAYKYGIKLGKSGDTGLKIGALSTDTEIDHIEIANADFAGIMAKTDFGGSPPADAPDMNNVNIHDTYIHDTLGEGMYIGETKTPGQEFRHLQIWNNVVTRTGLDLAQIANVVEDAEVHNNVMYEGGTLNKLYQNKGFQIGDNTVGRYYDNFIMKSPSNSMIIMGSGNIEVFNNYIQGTNSPSFFIDNRSVTIPGAPIDISRNYIMEVAEPAAFFSVYNELNPINITGNHLEGNNVEIVLGSNAGPNVTLANNTREVIGRVQFTDVQNDNFTLTSSSPHQDKGLLGAEKVASMNKRPFIALISDQQITEKSVTEVAVIAQDPDNDAMVLEGFNMPAFVSFRDAGGGKGTFTLAPGPGDVGTYYKVRVRVTDSDGGSNSQYFDIKVSDSFAFIASASSTDGTNYPENTLDMNMATRWAPMNATGEWIKYDMMENKLVTAVSIAFYNGSLTKYTFGIEVSGDDVSWTQVFAGQSSGASEEIETFSFAEVQARYLRIVDTGDGINSYKEVSASCTTAPQVHRFYPTDDVYVDANKIYDNTVLKTYHPRRVAHLRYSVSGLDVATAPVVSARLKLTPVESASATLETSLGNHTNWSETTIKKGELPSAAKLLNTLSSSFTSGQVYEVDVAVAVADNGTYSFILAFKNSAAGIAFSAREGVYIPELEVTTLRGARTTSSSARTYQVSMESVVEPTDNTDDASGGLVVYPNPVGNHLTVDFGAGQPDLISVEICDQLGKTFYRSNVADAKFLDLDAQSLHMEPGVYFVKIKKEGSKVQVLRLIKR